MISVNIKDYVIKDYIIKDVGEYQLCGIYNNNFIIKLNALQEDTIIKSKYKTFLILKHVIISDYNFINFIMNSKDMLEFDIKSNHICYSAENGEEFRINQTMKGILVNMRMSCRNAEFTVWNMIFEISDIKKV